MSYSVGLIIMRANTRKLRAVLEVCTEDYKLTDNVKSFSLGKEYLYRWYSVYTDIFIAEPEST